MCQFSVSRLGLGLCNSRRTAASYVGTGQTYSSSFVSFVKRVSVSVASLVTATGNHSNSNIVLKFDNVVDMTRKIYAVSFNVYYTLS